MSANVAGMSAGSLVDADDFLSFANCRHRVRFVSTAVHELLGHGAGKLLCEDSEGNFNFDQKQLPISPITKKPIDSWYGPGQTWTTVFGDIAASVEECRACLVAAYLMDNTDLVSVFGYSKTSEVSAKDCEAGIFK